MKKLILKTKILFATKMDCDFIITADVVNQMIPCAIRLKAPQSTDRIPTHIILLLDVSESMQVDNKLENVKRCCELILDFLNENDRLSLITFGETGTLYLNSVSVSDLQKGGIRDVIKKLYVNGCTNLSAGLAYVKEVCSEDTSNLKTGLLLLTDGYANRGMCRPTDLIDICSQLKTSFTNLSIHCVAYGTDHNADLLKTISEQCSGSYNIVKTIEDTAFAFGDTLGGLMSCAFQNVIIKVPEESKIHGPHTTRIVDGRKQIVLGDIYSGTKPLILFDIPSQTINDPEVVQIQGSLLPSLEKFTIAPICQRSENEREIDIELTRLRYTCTDLLKAIGSWHRLDAGEKSALSERIDAFEMAVNDAFYNGNSVAALLRNEVSALKQGMREDSLSREDNANLNQHIASIGLARGFSTPMRPIRVVAPTELTPEEEAEPLEYTFQNAMQSQIASVMRSISQDPH